MKIGLFGDYDIDDIIPFFNTSGTVTFSNEPEKYYVYDILDAIDYERLVGTINLSLNGVHLFRIDLSTANSITIDTERLEAYNEDIWMNRYVVGNYDKFVLKVGPNSVSWDGTLTYIAFEKQSRWI